MTSSQQATSRFEKWQPRNWSLAYKLAAVLLVPVVLSLSLGVARVIEHARQADALAAVDRFVALDGKAVAVLDTLERERAQAAVFVQNNQTGDPVALRGVFGATDGNVTELITAVGDPASLGGAAQAAYERAKANLDRLTQLRDQVTTTGATTDTTNGTGTHGTGTTTGTANGSGTSTPTDAAAVIASYTGVIEPMLVFQAALDRRLNTPALAGPAAALTALASAREQVTLQHAVLAVAIARGQLLPADADTVRGSDAVLASAIDQYRAALDADLQTRFAGFITDPVNNQRQQLKQNALSRANAPRGQLGISPADWDSASTSVLEQMNRAGDGLRGDLRQLSAAQQAAARNSAGIDSVILLLALLAAATVVFLVGRSMLKPLRVLRSTALDIAEHRLPEAVQRMRSGKVPNVAVKPVPVNTIEEIGQVARAFDEVHGQAIRLAAEQATLQTNVGSMFVNLSRRSQVLVERQLALIEQLERNEQDAEQLANLFQLDHLATRMRRNSENLLVLAGSDLSKRGSQPVPLVDVLRAGVSEIEQYQRVVVQPPPSVRLAGRAANDMVHLVAELLDNATAFSAPDTQVVVSSTISPDGSALVEIVDQGVGMPGEELLAVNNRLAAPSDVDVSASRRMGLFVVGRLAARHGVRVRLANTEQVRGDGSGITATVHLPAGLIVRTDGEHPAQDRVAASARLAESRGVGSTRVERTGTLGVATELFDRGELAAPGRRTNGASVKGSLVNGSAVGPVADGMPAGGASSDAGGDRAGAEPARPAGPTARAAEPDTRPTGARDTGTADAGTEAGPPASSGASGVAASPERGAGGLPRRTPLASARRSEATELPRRSVTDSGLPRRSVPGASSPTDPAEPPRRSAPAAPEAAPSRSAAATGGVPTRRPEAAPSEAGRAAPPRPEQVAGAGPRAEAGQARPVPSRGAPTERPETGRADARRPEAGQARPVSSRGAAGERVEAGRSEPPRPEAAQPRPGRGVPPRPDQVVGAGPRAEAGQARPVSSRGAPAERVEHADVPAERRPRRDTGWSTPEEVREQRGARPPLTGTRRPLRPYLRTQARQVPPQPSVWFGGAGPDTAAPGPDNGQPPRPSAPVAGGPGRTTPPADGRTPPPSSARTGLTRPAGSVGDWIGLEPPVPAGLAPRRAPQPAVDPERPAWEAQQTPSEADADPLVNWDPPAEPDPVPEADAEFGAGATDAEFGGGTEPPEGAEPEPSSGAELSTEAEPEGAEPVDAAEPANGELTAPPTENRWSGAAEAVDRARRRRSESPIFEEMASAWFRENADLAEPAAESVPIASADQDDPAEWAPGDVLLRPMPEPAESNQLTPAGLPKRRPRSQLIPSSPGGEDAPAHVPSRSAEQVRGRLSSYQHGVRQGRQSRHRWADPSTVGRPAQEKYGEENS